MKINVLSLFDGMSCGRIALERNGTEIGTYYASEIDKWATKVSEDNYPDIVRLGDVTKWQDWDIDWSSIDLVLGGFPCQAWSMAGKQLGDKDERGMLFWTMLDIISHVRKFNPKADFLIENVKMKKEFEEYITHHTQQALGTVHKILVNSALVSAQNRNRYYWTSWECCQPEDKEVTLDHIIETNPEFENQSEGWYKWFANNVDNQIGKSYSNICNFNEKAITMTARQYASWNGNFLIIKQDGVKDIQIDLSKEPPYAFYEARTELGKKLRRELSKKKGKDTSARCLKSKMYKNNNHQKSNCLTATRSFFETIMDSEWRIRKLTPIECERLQTVPDNYTSCVSNAQRYKMLGNGWTVDVICHLLKCEF